jgi:hypothetical protein
MFTSACQEHITDAHDGPDPIYRDLATLQHNLESIEAKGLLNSRTRPPILDFNRHAFAKNSHELWNGLKRAYEQAQEDGDERIKSEIASAHARMRSIRRRIL